MKPRSVGAILALLAIVPLITAVFTRGWMTTSTEEGKSEFGLLSGQVCRGTECQGGTWAEALSDAGREDSRVKLVVYGGYAAVGGTLVLALLLLGVAVFALRRPDAGIGAPLLVVIGSIAGMAGAIGTLVLLEKWVGRLSGGQLDPSWGTSAFVFLGGSMLAIVAGVLMMVRPRGGAEMPAA